MRQLKRLEMHYTLHMDLIETLNVRPGQRKRAYKPRYGSQWTTPMVRFSPSFSAMMMLLMKLDVLCTLPREAGLAETVSQPDLVLFGTSQNDKAETA